MPRIRRTGLRPPWLAVMGAIANSSNATAMVPKHPVINGTHPLRKRIGCPPSTPVDTEALTTEMISSLSAPCTHLRKTKRTKRKQLRTFP